MNNIRHLLYDYLVSIGTSETLAKYLNFTALLIVLILVVFIIDYVSRKILLNTFTQYAKRTKSNFDDILVANKVSRNVAHIIPLIITLKALPVVFTDFMDVEGYIAKGLKVFGIILTLWIARSVLNSLKDYFKTLPRLKDKPIDSYIQVFMIFAWIIGVFSAVAILWNIKIEKFLTGLGAASAIIILIFRDTILGFVASIQVAINDMVRIGDWITFDKYGADGDVIEINLSTVKVQNFDKTITTIPTYALISDSFKNWRGMTNSDGRRIKRSLSVRLNSVRYLTANEINKIKNIELISEYLSNRQNTIDTHNAEKEVKKEMLLNGRNLTNLGVFRKYIETYLQQHSAINKNMTIMVRQLAPTTQGIPLEVYAFSNDKHWENYEYIVADIFDHLIAATSYFDLELFELPNNSNFITK